MANYKKKPNGKNDTGRPSKYKKEYVQQLIDYFDIPAYEKHLIEKETQKGNIINIETERANDLKFIEGFCKEIGIHKDTFHEWRKAHKDFSDAYKRIKALQRDMLVTNGLRGNYNASFAIFTAKNILGWRDNKGITFNGRISNSELSKTEQEELNRITGLLDE